MCHYLIRATGAKGTIINMVSLGASFVMPGISYSTSKLAVIKLGEHLNLGTLSILFLVIVPTSRSRRSCYWVALTSPSTEHPELRVFSIHPGVVKVEDGRGAMSPVFELFAHDKALLTGAVMLYLQQSKADFLRSGYYSVNWDIEELTEHKDEVVEKKMLQLAFIGGRMQPGGVQWAKAD